MCLRMQEVLLPRASSSVDWLHWPLYLCRRRDERPGPVLGRAWLSLWAQMISKGAQVEGTRGSDSLPRSIASWLPGLRRSATSSSCFRHIERRQLTARDGPATPVAGA